MLIRSTPRFCRRCCQGLQRQYQFVLGIALHLSPLQFQSPDVPTTFVWRSLPTFNYKDGSETVSLSEIENSDLLSDLTASTLPKNSDALGCRSFLLDKDLNSKNATRMSVADDQAPPLLTMQNQHAIFMLDYQTGGIYDVHL